MKLALWAYSVAVTLAALLSVFLGSIFQNIYEHMLNGKPLPNLTYFFLHVQWWILLIALPFVGGSFWLGCHPTATSDRIFAFEALSTLAIVFLLAFPIVSLSLPFVAITVSMQ